MHFVSRILDAFGGGGQSVYIERHRCTRSLSLQQTVTDSNSYAAKQNGKRRPRLGKDPDRISADHSTRTSSCARAFRPGPAKTSKTPCSFPTPLKDGGTIPPYKLVPINIG